MPHRPLDIADSFLITGELHGDDRGTFFRIYDKTVFEESIGKVEFVQHNVATTTNERTFRGLHLQTDPKAEAKLFSCLQGRIFDVLSDLRPTSPTQGTTLTLELSSDRNESVFIPPGVAHGYLTLTNDVVVDYLTSREYSPAHEIGVRWDDPRLNLQLPQPPLIVSEKDQRWPMLRETSPTC